MDAARGRCSELTPVIFMTVWGFRTVIYNHSLCIYGFCTHGVIQPQIKNICGWEAELWRSWFEASPGKKLVKLHLKNQARYGGSVIPAIWEAEVVGCSLRGTPGQKHKTLSKK
jgi:hypothetical protein